MTNVSSYTIATVISLQSVCTCITFTLGQYIYAFYLSKYQLLSQQNQTLTTTTVPSFLSTVKSSISDKCTTNGIVVNRIAQSWAQKRSADLFFWANLWSCCPIIIMTYILGIYTPKLGRRYVLTLPMIGMACQLSIWLTIIYFDLPEYWWYIAAFIVGLSGSDNIRNFVLNLFITENSVEHERSSHFVLFGAITMIVSAVATFTIGYYIAWKGFINLYWIAFILQLISIFTVLTFFKPDKHIYKTSSMSANTNSLLNTTNMQLSKITCSSCFDLYKIFEFKDHSRKRSISLLLILTAYASYTFICTAFGVILLYLLNAPFCWTSKHIGNYSTIALISFGIFSVLGMKILTKLGACDIIICVISHLFFCTASLWLAFAEHDWQMYVGLILTSLSGYQNLLTVSMISKWLQPHECTNMFTLVTEINTIMKVVGFCFFNWVYAHTVVEHKNFTFILAAFLNVIPLALNICLWLVSKKMPNDSTYQCEEIDLATTKLTAPTSDWVPQVGVVNSMLLSQQLAKLSKTNLLLSTDYENRATVHDNIL